MVCAGAGYGKTEAVSRFLEDVGAAYCWYRVSEEEQDLFLFVDYLVCSIRQQVEQFCTDHEPGQYIGWGPRALGAFIVGRLQEKVKTTLYVILDDWHLAEPSQEVAEFVRYLIENTPAQVRFIIMTQADSVLPVAKLLVSGNAAVLNQNDFLFNTIEAAALFDHLQGSEEEKHQVVETALLKTRGWAAGLSLIAASISEADAGQANRIISGISGADRLFSNYLDTAIFQQLTTDQRQFLIHTSVLKELKPGLCRELTGLDNSMGMLETLESSNLFIRRLKTNVFRYEDLFRQFLIARLSETIGESAVKKLHNRAGELYESRGDTTQALYYYRNGENTDAVCRLLVTQGDRMIYNGHHAFFLSYSGQLPARLIEENPDLLLYLACIDSYRGRMHEAVMKIDRAHELSRQNGDHQGCLKCQVHLANFDFQAGAMKKTARLLKTIIDEKPAAPHVLIDTLLNYAYCCSYMARFEASDRALSRAGKMIAHLPGGIKKELMQEALTFHRMVNFQHKGDFLKARECLTADSAIVKMMISQLQQDAWSLYHLGQFEKGIERAQMAIEFLNRNNIDDFFMQAWCRVAVSINLMGLDRLEQALEMLNRADIYFSELKFAWGLGFVSWVGAKIKFRHRQYSQALEEISKGLKTIKDLGLILPECAMRIVLIKTLFMLEKNDEAASEIRAFGVREDFNNIMESQWMRAQYFGIHLVDRVCNNDVAAGLSALDQMVHICRTQGYDIHEILEQDLFMRLKPFERQFINSSTYHTLENYYTERMSRLHSLQISFFGKFTVSRGLEPIPDKSWNNQKARILFQYLVLHREDGFVSKEVLMELLWPEEDPEKSSKRFHVTLAALRKILQPDIKRKEPSAYIRSAKDAYRIDPGANAVIDTESFMALCENGNTIVQETPEMIDAWLTAVSLYKADFLIEETLQDWSHPFRDRFKEVCLTTLGRIIAFYERQQDLEKCIEFIRLYLEREPYDETYYQKLMICYNRAGRKKQVMETFACCRKTIEKELACDLSEDTTRLYNQLMARRN